MRGGASNLLTLRARLHAEELRTCEDQNAKLALAWLLLGSCSSRTRGSQGSRASCTVVPFTILPLEVSALLPLPTPSTCNYPDGLNIWLGRPRIAGRAPSAELSRVYGTRLLARAGAIDIGPARQSQTWRGKVGGSSGTSSLQCSVISGSFVPLNDLSPSARQQNASIGVGLCETNAVGS